MVVGDLERHDLRAAQTARVQDSDQSAVTAARQGGVSLAGGEEGSNNFVWDVIGERGAMDRKIFDLASAMVIRRVHEIQFQAAFSTPRNADRCWFW
jgi:hypothetical protein